MSSSVVRIEFSQVKSLALIFNNEYTRVSQINQDLQDLLQELRANGWSSPAAEVFYTDMDGHLASLNQLATALDQSESTLYDIMRVFQTADSDASDLILTLFSSGGMSMIGVLRGMDWLQIAKVASSWFKINELLGNNILEAGIDHFVDFFGNNADGMSVLNEKYRLLEGFTTTTGGKLIRKVGIFGSVSGLLDFGVGAMAGEHDWTDIGELGVQTTSGMIQAGLVLVPGGAFLLKADFVAQASLTGLETVAKPVANFFGHDGNVVASTISDAREFISLDRVVDDGVRWVGKGILDTVSESVSGVGDFFGF